MMITDRSASPYPLTELAAGAIRGGVTVIQLREKDLSSAELLQLALGLAEVTRSLGAKLVVNEDVDVALAVCADGIHLPVSSPPVPSVRAITGSDFLIGRSTHDLAEAERAQEEGADYVTFGPIFETPSKRGLLVPRGLDALRRVSRRLSIPVLALGGVNSENVQDLLRWGASGVAAIRAFVDSRDPYDAAQCMSSAFGVSRSDGETQ